MGSRDERRGRLAVTIAVVEKPGDQAGKTVTATGMETPFTLKKPPLYWPGSIIEQLKIIDPLTSEQYPAPRSWTEQAYPNLIYFNEVDKGGHFAAWEEPELLSSEIRAAFRPLR